ncbi:MAG: DUF2505 family protein [bacterium]
MNFEYRHSFAVPVDTLIEAVFHPDLPPFLTEKMTTIISIEPLERQEDDTRLTRRVKYVPVPMINRIGTKKVTPEAMQWIEVSSFDKRTKVMTFENVPTHPKIRAKMTNSGRMEFVARGSDRSERIITGELKVKFPLLGRVAEGIISKNGKKLLDEEAQVLSAWMREHK